MVFKKTKELKTNCKTWLAQRGRLTLGGKQTSTKCMDNPKHDSGCKAQFKPNPTLIQNIGKYL